MLRKEQKVFYKRAVVKSWGAMKREVKCVFFYKGHLWFCWFGLFTDSRREKSGKCSGGSNLPWKPLTESTHEVAAVSLVFWMIIFRFDSINSQSIVIGSVLETQRAFAAVLFTNTNSLWLLIITVLLVKVRYIYFYNFMDYIQQNWFLPLKKSILQ